MRKRSKIIVVLFILFGCQSSSEEKSATNSSKELPNGGKFFEYDEIDYYASDFDESNLKDLIDHRSISEIDSLKTGVLVDDIPKDINDLYFIDKLGRLGFRKISVNKSKFSSIDSIFKEKTVKRSIALTCIHVYRDILIFKKQNKAVGIAKICFSCMANQITGTGANTENFGQEGDYKKLEKLLHE